eukprot:NODE_6711_length_1646_cov_3.202765.p2 GENE.NODE_6711_length_1646_cov_3.202765~~NODE_6711_length_1646_cov_3.202765.p2  ORF type:complete len:256 (-),score=52.72 NODE_6711_length_1646_cov_3.202765:82-849(-)
MVSQALSSLAAHIVMVVGASHIDGLEQMLVTWNEPDSASQGSVVDLALSSAHIDTSLLSPGRDRDSSIVDEECEAVIRTRSTTTGSMPIHSLPGCSVYDSTAESFGTPSPPLGFSVDDDEDNDDPDKDEDNNDDDDDDVGDDADDDNNNDDGTTSLGAPSPLTARSVQENIAVIIGAPSPSPRRSVQESIAVSLGAPSPSPGRSVQESIAVSLGAPSPSPARSVQESIAVSLGTPSPSPGRSVQESIAEELRRHR